MPQFSLPVWEGKVGPDLSRIPQATYWGWSRAGRPPSPAGSLEKGLSFGPQDGWRRGGNSPLLLGLRNKDLEDRGWASQKLALWGEQRRC